MDQSIRTGSKRIPPGIHRCHDLNRHKSRRLPNAWTKPRKIVVGEILSIAPHPDADKLIICQVNIGSETIQIVTGAPNVKEGDKVPVVLDGGKVAGGHDGGPLPEEGIKIKKES